MGSSFDWKPDERDFSGLFRYFESRLPQGQRLLLKEEQKKLLFQVWFGDDFLTGEVFFIPIQLLNRTEGALRDILLSFFQLFGQMHQLKQKEYLYDYRMIVDGDLEEWCGQDCETEVRDFLAAYREGYINDTFSAVYQKPGRTRAELEKFIENYIPENDAERKLIASIRQGIRILGMNKNIFDYACRPWENDGNCCDDMDEDYFIGAERMIRLVYSGGDYVSESLLEYINVEIRDCGSEYFPRNSLVLSPETAHPLEVDFVECFFTWLIEFINVLYQYE